MPSQAPKSHDTTVEIQGKMFPVTLDRRLLTFTTTVGDVEVSGASKEQLEERIRRELARQKVELVIPVVLHTDHGLVRAILRGRNQRTSEYLFTIDGEKQKVEYPKIVALEVSDEVLARGNALAAEHVRARQTLDAFLATILPKRSGSLDPMFDHMGRLDAHHLVRVAERAQGVTS